ncbi:choice-of-anchor D domain-containing protein [Micromonospora sp. LZ34]
MRIFRALLGMGVATACAVAGLPGVAVADATTPTSILVVDAGDQTRFGYGIYSGVFDSRYEEVQTGLGGRDALTMTAHFRAGTVHDWTGVHVTPPEGETWQAGRTYATAEGGIAARLSVDASGRTCTGTGQITVRQVARDAETQQLTAFAAAYAFRCNDDSGVIDGELRWNSDLDYQAVSYASPLDFGPVEIGAAPRTRTVTLTSTGTVPVTFGALTVAGPDAATFQVTGNDCTGRTLVLGDDCTLQVAAGVTSTAVRAATIFLADDTSHGSRRVRLSISGYHNAVGTYYPRQGRILDTRVDGTAPAPIGPAGVLDLQVAGRAGVPAEGVGAVVVNVTVVRPTAGGYLTLYPAGESRPTASSINFAAGWLGSNLVTAKLGAGGKISIYNHTGATHVVVDVVGFYAASDAARGHLEPVGGQVHPVTPIRLFDTRVSGGALSAGETRRGWVDFGPELDTSAQSLIVNITVVAPEKGGFLTAWAGGGDRPGTSTVNYDAGRTVPNLAVVQTMQCHGCGTVNVQATFSLYSSQKAHVVVDLVGVVAGTDVPNGLRFTPKSPTRIVDSRYDQGTTDALGANVTRKVTTPAALITDATRALAMNVTAVSPTSGTVITVWPADTGATRPTASNLNPAAGQTVSNAVLSGIGPADAFHLHNLLGSTHLVADVVGTFELYPYTVGTGEGFRVHASGIRTW